MTGIDQRSLKALDMDVERLVSGGPLFKVTSRKLKKGVEVESIYNVYFGDDKRSCECKDWEIQTRRGEDNFRCKHVRAVELYKVKEDLGLEGIAIVNADAVKLPPKKPRKRKVKTEKDVIDEEPERPMTLDDL